MRRSYTERVRSIAKRAGVTQVVAWRVYRAVAEEIVVSLRRGGVVDLPGLGRFRSWWDEPRQCRCFGKDYQVGRKLRVKFKAGRYLRS
ncbi:MAG: HU family DNA-binding protein [Sphaerochaeta sp.]|jgi:nucleoid DNA-binding protein|nr:HU family DNA-binding protein [Sphaerochaeta sp.]